MTKNSEENAKHSKGSFLPKEAQNNLLNDLEGLESNRNRIEDIEEDILIQYINSIDDSSIKEIAKKYGITHTTAFLEAVRFFLANKISKVEKDKVANTITQVSSVCPLVSTATKADLFAKLTEGHVEFLRLTPRFFEECVNHPPSEDGGVFRA